MSGSFSLFLFVCPCPASIRSLFSLWMEGILCLSYENNVVCAFVCLTKKRQHKQNHPGLMSLLPKKHSEMSNKLICIFCIKKFSSSLLNQHHPNFRFPLIQMSLFNPKYGWRDHMALGRSQKKGYTCLCTEHCAMKSTVKSPTLNTDRASSSQAAHYESQNSPTVCLPIKNKKNT